MSSPSYPYYLPVNPCCTPTTPCATPICCPDPCASSCGDPCANPCYVIGKRTDDLAYNGENLPCTDIDQCDTLTVVLQKIEAAICTLQDLLIPTTTTTTTVIPTTTTTTTIGCIIDGFIIQIS